MEATIDAILAELPTLIDRTKLSLLRNSAVYNLRRMNRKLQVRP